MSISNLITKQDLGEPYNRLIDVLELPDILKLEELYAGRDNIRFRRNSTNIREDHPELHLALGEEKSRKVVKLLGGMALYFPGIKQNVSEKIKHLILQEYNGYNITALAKTFGYTDRHVRRILKHQGKTAEHDENQMQLKDFLPL